VTAWIAGRAKIWHAAVMGAVEVLLTLWAMHAMPHQAPWWSWVAGIIFTIPAAWFGGLIRARRASRSPPPIICDFGHCGSSCFPASFEGILSEAKYEPRDRNAL